MRDGCVEGEDLNEEAVVCFEEEQRFLRRALLVCREFQQHIPRRMSKTVMVQNIL
jgi:hypothetical protein